MIKRITILLMLAALVVAPLGTILSSPEGLGQVKDLESLEEYLQDNFWERQPLIDLARWFQLTGGLVERNDVFYSEEGLIEDFQPEDPYAASTVNTREIIHFSESNSCPVALVLIPTARAVKQEQVPAFLVDKGFNQKTFIDDSYRGMAGYVTTVDAYAALLPHRNEYIYYRTDTNPTAYGGYLIYQELARRLRFTPVGMEELRQEHLEHNYLGNLYDRWGYGGVEPDILTAYRLQEDVGYRVTHRGGRPRSYFTLYPQYKLQSQDPYALYLGGISPWIDLETSGLRRDDSLLVFGDRATVSYLPLLTSHYQSITFIDLSQITTTQLEDLDLSQYDQVLFSYSVDTYVTDDSLQKLAVLSGEG